ncbi:MAG: hypothetical protein ACOZQL_12050 [Myxococcota bacterium]
MMRAILLAVLAIAAAACVTAQDEPTNVHDLRVLGMRFEPPEVMIKGCNAQLLLAAAGSFDGGTSIELPPQLALSFFAAAATPLEFSTLVADPAGNGRNLDYRVLACANRSDRDCNDQGKYVELARGSRPAGEWKLRVMPGTQVLDDGNDAGFPLPDGGTGSLLLLEVIQEDTFKGLGGVRVPIVLEVSAPDTGEKIFAQKLMVYSCQFFPQMKQNVTPILPGIRFKDEPWPEDEVKEVSGKGEVALSPEDFSSLQEPYVVPSIELKPYDLVESWKITWMTTSGTMTAYNTGGTDFVGNEGRHNSRWKPDQKATEPQDVTLYFVVRDGRGGQSWTTRRLRWSP